eukprot:Selendium_serpulae@DN1451_c0_g1_i2.p1
MEMCQWVTFDADTKICFFYNAPGEEPAGGFEPTSGSRVSAPEVFPEVGCTTCRTSEWSHWSQCDALCDQSATVFRNRNVTYEPFPGDVCPYLSDSKECHGDPCPMDCAVSQWSSWTSCGRSCGNASKTRTRFVTNPPTVGGEPCPPEEELVEAARCNLGPCPVDCEVSEWCESACDVSCGEGSMTYSREVVVSPAHGGRECPALTRKGHCSQPPCPTDCLYTEWNNWSDCSCSAFDNFFCVDNLDLSKKTTRPE